MAGEFDPAIHSPGLTAVLAIRGLSRQLPDSVLKPIRWRGVSISASSGLFAGGGSIIALPALLYLLHIEPKSVIAMSPGVMGTVAGARLGLRRQ